MYRNDWKKSLAPCWGRIWLLLALIPLINNCSPVKPALKPPPENPIELSAKCDRCHGENGFSAVLNIPRIGGQIESYLVKSLQAYKGATRTNSAMHAMSDVLSDLEINAIAKYYSGQKQTP